MCMYLFYLKSCFYKQAWQYGVFIIQLSVCDVPQLFWEFGKCCADQTGARRALRYATSRTAVCRVAYCVTHCGTPYVHRQLWEKSQLQSHRLHCCHIRVWIVGILKESHQENRGIWNVDIPATAASIMVAAHDQRLAIKNEANLMLVKQMSKRKMKHFGHIIRHNSLEKTSGRNKEIISLVRRTSVTSNLLVRHSHHLSN